jgi:rfaE bifunctional protein nucleotidyltransferase chain/domain
MTDDREKIIDEIRKRRDAGETCVFTNGCFDLIHAGHIHLLRESSALGDFLVVGLNSDDSVGRLKGPDRPVNNQESRKIVLEALRFVDYVLMFEEDTPLDLIRELKPDVLVKGGDYTPDTVVGREVVESYGGKVRIVPVLEGFSTSKTIIDLDNLDPRD